MEMAEADAVASVTMPPPFAAEAAGVGSSGRTTQPNDQTIK